MMEVSQQDAIAAALGFFAFILTEARVDSHRGEACLKRRPEARLKRRPWLGERSKRTIDD
jgi:hypothetical protein